MNSSIQRQLVYCSSTPLRFVAVELAQDLTQSRTFERLGYEVVHPYSARQQYISAALGIDALPA